MIGKIVLAAALTAAGSVGVAHATYLQTTFSDGMTTQVQNAVVYDFNGVANGGGKPAAYSGDGWVLPSSVSGMAAAPAGDNTPFLSVAFPNASGTETLTVAPGSNYNYFGLYWGSIDDYNWLEFYNGDTLLARVTGLDVIQAGTALGDQVAAGANRYVNFEFLDNTFDSIVFGTSNFAFESDNHALATVPEPGTFALMGAGLAAFGFMRKRRLLAAKT
jgi:hypothetical protein